jgi:hypothetical protein
MSDALLSAGLSIVADAEDQPAWVEERISGIMNGCGAFAAVLPYRPGAPHMTSNYVLREWRLADRPRNSMLGYAAFKSRSTQGDA